METTARVLLEKFLDRLGIFYSKIETEKIEDNIIRLNIKTTEPAHLIGHRGETLEAIQYLLKQLLWSKMQYAEKIYLIVDVEEYKKKQEQRVLDLADAKAAKLRETGITQHLPPSPAYIRKLTHLHFRNEKFSDLESKSEGEGHFRHVTLVKKETV
ncbi:hypothetical protein COT40_00750 [Candidatus Peregrinibacteria bacterium CG08_land_8_20_14_0_20_41_10]|nr:MAG: hypothetical protein AUJ78_01145 [Candidatus Peregrinibacteria bacterium CG1_02_41_10]PIS32287.1 MAG: hypothetical protein COT40_00750 [Candidatus Peregrinibacteria bacterium CG08_land_8_20_14_0_20_41_10]